jgi:hypothetical protein
MATGLTGSQCLSLSAESPRSAAPIGAEAFYGTMLGLRRLYRFGTL